jgi:hypothetical protein
MKLPRIVALTLATLFLVAAPLGVSAATPQATRATNIINDIPIRGDVAGGGVFRGTLDLLRFRVVDGALVAVGDLSGTLRNAAGDVVGTITDQRVRLPVALGSITSCDILRLRLGPLDLDLLGLQVHLDRVVLDITAQAGPGNLLGNLLCAIAGLLDQGLNLNGVLRDLLNAVLGVLML